MLANPDFQNLLLQACKDLSQPGMVRKLCIHETAHLFYFEMVCTLMGSGTPKPEFVEPMITYDEFEEKPEDRFKAILASVKTPFKEYGIVYTDEILDSLARGAVGGGIFLTELEKAAKDESGDENDRNLFAGHFMLAQDQGWVPS